jgi:predicted ATPase
MRGGALGPAAPVDLPPGGLTGRSAEAAAIGRLLGGSRLVTVTGLPGVGKTAVSLEAAACAAANFAGGAVLVRLDALRDEALLPHSILAALRIPDRFTSSPLEVLVDQLRDRHILLIFDNCEHLLGACAAITSALLQPCAKLQVLATSREPLRVPDESALPVAPLLLPDAIELFSWRASQRGRQITAADHATVAAICVQLDQLPLAIELAAGQLAPGQLASGQLAPGQLASAELADLLAAVETDIDILRDPGHAIVRHRSLRAAIGWSHELCTPAERLAWARLSVFTGPFLTGDAQNVCATSQLPDKAVAVALTLLTERSVLLADTQADGLVHYLLPTTLRAYGRRMLRQLAEDAQFQDRYQRWCRSQPTRRGTPTGP